jgi:hypothetical protein
MPAPDPLGYSGTPLPRKLGIAPAARVAALGAAPADLASRLDGVPLHGRLRGAFAVILLFAPDAATLRRLLAPAVAALEPGGGALWIAWPKRASGVATDVDERMVRELGLATGLVDNRVAAIDATWSGLRFVRRRAPAQPRVSS